MFSSWDDAWINDPVKAMTRKLSGKPNSDTEPVDKISNPRTDIYNFSSPSINLSELSVNTTPYKKKLYKRDDIFNTSDFVERDEPGCTAVTNHLQNCDRCYAQFKKMVDRKVNDRLHDIMLFSNINRQTDINTTQSDSWKETLIIVVGAVIVIFILYLMTKSLTK
uniref:Uncharacterized protein n=1 Tax=viral metagenome TaxID=1070528 RepID=A0A6C0CBY3_9ZZZZ